MPKLLQINSTANWGSTGKIAEQINQVAADNGWETYFAYGRYENPCQSEKIRIGSTISLVCALVNSRLLDNDGLNSIIATRRLVSRIKKINPSIIHLHNIHGYFLNYKILFEYLNTANIPVVWTLHDCWAFTGHCAHFVTAGCEKWKSGCYECPLIKDYPKAYIDRSQRNYNLKESLVTVNKKLHVVPVSDWLADLVRQSFLKDKDIQVINNGVDIDVFYPMTIKPKEKYRILGVSGVWNKDKGIYDFYKLRESLDASQYEIVLVGLTKEQITGLPDGITGIVRTSSVEELSKYYSSSNVFVNPTYADTFPTVNLEALACGTPVVTYRTGGSPESVTHNTGVIVEQGNVESMAESIKVICANGRERYVSACRERAELFFDKKKCYEKYLRLYESLL